MSIFSLSWTPSTAPPQALPSPIKRTYIDTPSGPIELLSAIPSTPTSKPPIFFAHGGCGHAGVWLEYMTFLVAHNIPCYAVSTRGHGNSHRPSFLRMVYGTTRGMLADDLVRAIKHVEEVEAQRTGAKTNVVLVGHSSGGGLAQYILSEGLLQVHGLVLLGSVPGFGSLTVYLHWWFILDPLFNIRMLFHGWHPNSPLSTDRLVRNAFFSKAKPASEVTAFRVNMPPYESFLWPIAMMFKFVDPKRMLRNIRGWGSGQRVFVLVGGGDWVTPPRIMRQLAEWYRKPFAALLGEKKIEAKVDSAQAGPGEDESRGEGVRFDLVRGAGHHVQNDVQWEEGARKLLEFYDQL